MTTGLRYGQERRWAMFMKDMNEIGERQKQVVGGMLEERIQMLLVESVNLHKKISNLKGRLPGGKLAALDGLLGGIVREATVVLRHLRKEKGAKLTDRQLDETLDVLRIGLKRSNIILDESGLVREVID